MQKELKRAMGCFLMVIMVIAIAGCATQYVDQGAVAAGAPDKSTKCDLESSAKQLIDGMLANPLFLANYNAMKEAKGRLPIAYAVLG